MATVLESIEDVVLLRRNNNIEKFQSEMRRPVAMVHGKLIVPQWSNLRDKDLYDSPR